MPRRNHIPRYRKHKQSGQAIVTLTDGLGRRRDVLLGKHGTPESRAEYARQIAEWESNGRNLPPRTVHTDLTINELLLRFLRHADQHYRRPDGTNTSEVDEYKSIARVMKEMYGHTPARDFGAMSLKTVRQRMIDLGLARGTINKRIIRVRRLFRWAIENELVPETIMARLEAVRGLQRGRTEARETEPVRPVAESVVEQTLEHACRQVAAMARLQLLTGMRPGEVVVMRAIDLDMSGKVWLYRPGSDQGPTGQHKTAHHGHQRIIAIGPKAQLVLRPFLKPNLSAFLFSPRERMEERAVELRKKRRTRVQPSQQHRRKRKPRKVPGDRYTVCSYALAVRLACDRAFPPPEPLPKRDDETLAQWQSRLTTEEKGELKAWQKAHRWHPHQLRHTAATRLRREFGLDVARVVLGHRSPQITEVYAEIDVNRAAEAMEKLG
jgi:integrase